MASEFEVEDLLARVASDFGYLFYPRDSEAGRVPAASVLAGQCVAGRLPPRELARWMHTRIGHGHDDDRVETLVGLDDRYDVAESTGGPLEEIDSDVRRAAERFVRAE